jgi:DNA-binding NtrC family response regulator
MSSVKPKSRKKQAAPKVAVLDIKEASEQFEESLREAGYEVEAIGQKTAETLGQSQTPHVFVINMSLRGAKRILRKARALGSRIVVTANIYDTEKIADSMEDGAEEYLIKGPGDAKELPRIVRRLVRT